MKPQRVSVLLNVSSGAGKGAAGDQLGDLLKSAFESHDISASVEFMSGANLRSAAERAVSDASRGELNAVIIGGGDGSIRTVASVLVGSDLPLGVIPLGTWNHFAKDLKIPLAVEEAVAVIAAGEIRAVDVGEVNGRIFINNSSIGIYPYLVLERERRRRQAGLSKLRAMIMAGLSAIRYFPLHRLSICVEGRVEPCRSPCVFVGNNEYHLTGLALGSREKLDQGQLCLYVARQQSMIQLLWLACRSFLGFLNHTKDLRMLTVPTVEISSRHRRVLVAFDGEIEIIRSPLQYRARPGVLRVFAPAAADA